jgi:hypothetical protein
MLMKMRSASHTSRVDDHSQDEEEAGNKSWHKVGDLLTQLKVFEH